MNDPYSGKKKKRTVKYNNFLEALRDLGSGTVSSAADNLGGMANDAFNQISGRQTAGELRPNQPLEVKKPQVEKYPERKFRPFRREISDLQYQERVLFKKAEEQTKAEIAAILEELKKLALSTKDLAKEIEIAAAQAPVDPGVYHQSFFEKLRQSIIFLRKKVNESATWLATHNQKSRKKNYYWAQFKKSGTKYLLSQERYMSTQAG